LHEFDLIARDGRLGQRLRDVGERAPETKRDGNQDWLSAQMPCKHLEQRSVGVDARSAELIVLPGLGGLYRPGDRLGDVFYMSWLQLRLAPSEQEEDG
jgi:hypothetical protein